MRDIIIRRGEMKDVVVLAGMLSRLFSIENEFKIDMFKQIRGLEMLLIDDRSALLVAEDGSTLAGMVTGQLTVSTAAGGYSVLLEDMFVAEEFRRTGIGGMLLNALVEWGLGKGAQRMQLAADISNPPALNFYGRNGFIAGRMRNYYKSLTLVCP